MTDPTVPDRTADRDRSSTGPVALIRLGRRTWTGTTQSVGLDLAAIVWFLLVVIGWIVYKGLEAYHRLATRTRRGDTVDDDLL